MAATPPRDGHDSREELGDARCEGGGSGSSRGLRLRAGDRVEVRSESTNAWIEGRVEDVLTKECTADGSTQPVGSVKVSCATGVKYVPPSKVASALRRASAEEPPKWSQRPRPSARSAVCQERLDARDSWNINEIRIQELFSSYDRDGSGHLEQEEYRQLLRDFNDGRSPTEQELHFMMRLADLDCSGTIQLNELHYGLRAWHSYRQIDDRVLSLFAEFDVDESGSVNLDELRDLLTAMNRGMPVPRPEVQCVLERSDVAGNGVINRSELLGAIAAWYVHVDRASTDIPRLVREAAMRTARDSDSAETWGDIAAELRGGMGGYSQVNDSELGTRGVAAHGHSAAGAPICTTATETASSDPLVHGGEDQQPGKFAKAAPFLTKVCRKFCYAAFLFLFGGALICTGWMFRDNTCPHNLDGVLLWFGVLTIILGCLAYVRTPHVFASRARLAVIVILVLLDFIGLAWSRGSLVQEHKHICGHVLVYWSVFVWNGVPLAACAYALFLCVHVNLLKTHDERLQKEMPA